MKPIQHTPHFLLSAAALTVALAGCGQTGPLYLPAKPAAVKPSEAPKTPTSNAAPAASSPAPASK